VAPVRASFVDVLRCPRCLTDRALALTATARDEREVREGTLTCASCGLERPVRDGIADLLHEAPDFVAREADGLERFARVMAADGWDEQRILSLPDIELEYWQGQAAAIRRVLAEGAFAPGQRILDVGSNTCWASNIFAREGLEVVALDIADAYLQGLRTADLFLREGTFFERMLSVMYAPALADASFDHVFCCEVLHHNDRANLDRTLRELFRVLKPGGRLTVVNEPLRFPLRLKLDHGDEVAEFEGNEHVYFLAQYVRSARAAGFEVSMPLLRAAREGPDLAALPAPTGRLAPVKRALRERPAGRRALGVRRVARYWWRHGVRGEGNLSLDCVKPGG
jgi:SAM-dependent methyltransferase